MPVTVRSLLAGVCLGVAVTALPASSSIAAAPTITIPSAVAPPANSSLAEAAAAASISAVAKAAAADITNVDRFNTILTVDGLGKVLLPADQLRSRLVFDFNTAPTVGLGGRITAAGNENFPLLTGSGLSTAVAFLEPCGMNSPHTHPRASEFLTTVQGSMKTGFMLENGFLANPATGAQTTAVETVLYPFQSTVFPMWSVHYQFNDNCEPANFVATLNSEDPGTSQIAQNFFFQNEKVVNVTLGEIQTINGQNIGQFADSLPGNLVQAVKSCLKRCGQA